VTRSPSRRLPSAMVGATGRDTGGRFTKGNAAALKHGARSQAHLQRLRDAAHDALATRRAEITADLGGGLSTLKSDLVERYVVAGALLGWMEDRLLAEGVITAKGAKKALFNAYSTQLAQVVNLARTLGLERRSKPVRSLADALASVDLDESHETLSASHEAER
jgi:hypothetical protein